MTLTAYLDPIGGLAGDMVLAALLDAGAPREVLEATVRSLGLEDVRIDISRSERSGMMATHVDVRTVPGNGRSACSMRAVIAEAALSDRVRARSLGAFDRLVSAEAEAHGVDASDVILHELGDDDTLVDICGAFALLDALGIERIVCAPLPIGRGITTTDHGPLPIPGPATMRLLMGMPVSGVPMHGELVTPTGAAIATACDGFGELPDMTVRGLGVGAGSRADADRPNVLRVTIGETVERPDTTRDVVVLQANVDDLVPELVPDVVEACFARGALDVWTIPIQMKKGRPAVLLSVLGRPTEERELAETLLRHSSTLGVRVQRAHRYELERGIREVQVDGHTIRIKVGLSDGVVVNLAPEHDDCAAAAAVPRELDDLAR